MYTFAPHTALIGIIYHFFYGLLGYFSLVFIIYFVYITLITVFYFYIPNKQTVHAVILAGILSALSHKYEMANLSKMHWCG